MFDNIMMANLTRPDKRRGILMRDNEVKPEPFETPDLGIAAFLLTKGCLLIVAERARGRYSFVFADKPRCVQLSIEYVNSEFAKFDSALKNLKNLIR